MFDLSVVAIVRNECRYLDEWIAFHQLVGVQHFFVYDNGSTDGTEALLLERDDVTTVWFPGSRSQLTAYQHALDCYGHLTKWMAFIDADEFLFSPTGLPVSTLLHRRFALETAVGVCWAMYGTSDLQSRPKRVTPAFRRRAPLEDPVHRHVKSIVRPEFTQGVSVDPHHFRVTTVDEHKRPFRGPFAPRPSWDLLRVNHYWSKSVAEAAVKAQVPRADNGDRRSLEQLLDPRLNEVNDPILLAYELLLELRIQAAKSRLEAADAA